MIIKLTNGNRKDILALIIGLFSMVKFRLLGTFALSEILIFSMLIFIPYLSFRKSEKCLIFYIFSFVWLIASVLSDLINGNSLENLLKGSFNIIFIILLIPFVFWVLSDNPRRMIYILIGNSLSCLYNFYFQRINETNIDDEIYREVWTVYAYQPLFIIVCGLLFYKGYKYLSYFIIELFAIWSLFNMSRNVFLLSTLGVLILLYIGNVNNENIKYKIDRIKKRSISLIIIGVITLFSSAKIYEYLASNNILGERAYSKYMDQKSDEMGLASGRKDFFQGVYFSMQKPLIGHGNYAKDKLNLNEEYEYFAKVKIKTSRRDKLLPSHSYIIGAWLYNGIIGLVYWIFILFLLLKFIRNYLLYDSQMMFIMLFLVINLIWNIFFSPFENRLMFTVTLISCILISNKNYSEYKN